jgi:hypothetical protein
VVVLQFHLEPTSRVEAVWWVDSPDLPSLYASAPRLVDCQRLALNLLTALDVKGGDVRSVFAGPAGRLGPPLRDADRTQRSGASLPARRLDKVARVSKVARAAGTQQ